MKQNLTTRSPLPCVHKALASVVQLVCLCAYAQACLRVCVCACVCVRMWLRVYVGGVRACAHHHVVEHHMHKATYLLKTRRLIEQDLLWHSFIYTALPLRSYRSSNRNPTSSLELHFGDFLRRSVEFASDRATPIGML